MLQFVLFQERLRRQSNFLFEVRSDRLSKRFMVIIRDWVPYQSKKLDTYCRNCFGSRLVCLGVLKGTVNLLPRNIAQHDSQCNLTAFRSK